MKNHLNHFSFESHQVRVICDQNGIPWFVAKDVCDALGISNARDAVHKLDDDEKGVGLTDTLGGPQMVATVSESGLYVLVLRCRDAVKHGTLPWRFRKWVTCEVLPQIRKNGGYFLPNALHEQPTKEHMYQQLIEENLGNLRLMVSFDKRHSMKVQHVAPNEIVTTAAQIPDLIANGGAIIPNAILPKIIEAVASRMK